jgi:hypothetical protein
MNLQDYSPQITQLVGSLIINNSAGGGYIGDTNAASGSWTAIQLVTETKFHTLTGNITGLANTLLGSAILLPAGLVLFGNFSAIQLHSGSVIAYVK